MDDAVRGYIDVIPPAHRPLFDRLYRLVLEDHPRPLIAPPVINPLRHGNAAVMPGAHDGPVKRKVPLAIALLFVAASVAGCGGNDGRAGRVGAGTATSAVTETSEPTSSEPTTAAPPVATTAPGRTAPSFRRSPFRPRPRRAGCRLRRGCASTASAPSSWA